MEEPRRGTRLARSGLDGRPALQVDAQGYSLGAIPECADTFDHWCARGGNPGGSAQGEPSGEPATPCLPAAVVDVGQRDKLAARRVQEHRAPSSLPASAAIRPAGMTQNAWIRSNGVRRCSATRAASVRTAIGRVPA